MYSSIWLTLIGYYFVHGTWCYLALFSSLFIKVVSFQAKDKEKDLECTLIAKMR